MTGKDVGRAEILSLHVYILFSGMIQGNITYIFFYYSTILNFAVIFGLFWSLLHVTCHLFASSVSKKKPFRMHVHFFTDYNPCLNCFMKKSFMSYTVLQITYKRELRFRYVKNIFVLCSIV